MSKKNRKREQTMGDYLLHPGKYKFGVRDFN
jgi:hypothetical protein